MLGSMKQAEITSGKDRAPAMGAIRSLRRDFKVRQMSSLLILIATVPAGAATSEQIGFFCTAADGSTMRLNIDLKKGRADDGSGWKPLHEITDVRVTIRGSNPDMMMTPMGPVFSTLALDRTTLVLSDQTIIPDRNINRTTHYQCTSGAPIDFKARRHF